MRFFTKFIQNYPIAFTVMTATAAYTAGAISTWPKKSNEQKINGKQDNQVQAPNGEHPFRFSRKF